MVLTIPRLNVIYNNRRLITILRSTPNKNELAKQTLSDYIEKIRDKPLLSKFHPDISVKGNSRDLKLTNNDGSDFKIFVWDPRVFKCYTVTIGETPFVMTGFAPSKLIDILEHNT
jgi:hypothetical protein